MKATNMSKFLVGASVLGMVLLTSTSQADILDQYNAVQDVTKNDIATLQTLKAEHFNFNIADNGESPLEIAAVMCSPEMVKLLLSAGASPDFSDPTSTFRYTVLEKSEDNLEKDSPAACKQSVDLIKAKSHDGPSQRRKDTLAKYRIYGDLYVDLAKFEGTALLNAVGNAASSAAASAQRKVLYEKEYQEFELQRALSGAAK
jgi:hypothetical protein